MPKRTIRMMKDFPPIHRIFDLFAEEEMAVFLDSSLQNALGRYSVIGLFPYLTLVKGETFTVNGVECEQSFEEYVKEYLNSHREENPTTLPIVSGAVGYFSYDYGREKEGVRSRHRKKVEIPDCILCFYDLFIVEDHSAHTLYLIGNGNLKDSRRMTEELLLRIRGITEADWKEENRRESRRITVEANFEKKEYLTAVEDTIRHIVEGDIYIMNMTQQLSVSGESGPYQVFRRLRRENPSPFGGYFQYGDFQIICASPERFLQMQNGHVMTRPIKGTRKRGTTPEEDEALKKELADSEKDKSELLMIVDLERNDLNRVCVPGSVKVTELFQVETYATVFHLVANVEGDLEEGKNVMDLIEAAFPGGSITGAPKLRAMEIIDGLEHDRRNLYTGSIGYLTLSGDCDLNIVIRTALHKDGVYQIGVGGGITCESELEFEYEETLQKAKALLEAIQG
ncbi:MAG: aminodeoxychorismate synthase component I [Lachnospiraceae bacterium]|nr:aminodeoxychorismate synthase component I [Lachnospiraceae bacterium]